MGYYTVFNLTIKPENNEIIRKFREKYDYAHMSLTEDGSPNEESKWYDCGKDLIEFSLEYPNYLFILEGEGEAHDDLWRLYAQNGKSFYSTPKIIWKKFNKNLLE